MEVILTSTGLQQLPVPRLLGMFLPRAAANLAEARGQRVEDERVRVCALAELGARDGVHMAIAVTDKDAGGREDLYSEAPFELAQQAEHPVDGTARRLGA